MGIRHFERCTVATMTWLTITEHMFHNDHGYVPFCRNLISVHSSFMTYYWSFDKSNMSVAFGSVEACLMFQNNVLNSTLTTLPKG
jgi:hypothetical protein